MARTAACCLNQPSCHFLATRARASTLLCPGSPSARHQEATDVYGMGDPACPWLRAFAPLGHRVRQAGTYRSVLCLVRRIPATAGTEPDAQRGRCLSSADLGSGPYPRGARMGVAVAVAHSLSAAHVALVISGGTGSARRSPGKIQGQAARPSPAPRARSPASPATLAVRARLPPGEPAVGPWLSVLRLLVFKSLRTRVSCQVCLKLMEVINKP